MDYDAIIVGARCAGSPLAMLLARKGLHVLLVDRASFPSDVVMSTHFITHAGAQRLHDWGLLDRVLATGCPSIATMTFDTPVARLEGKPTPTRDLCEAVAPRRLVLDQILLDAAIAAGVEFRDRTSLVDVIKTEGRATGVRLANGARTCDETSTIVIGADGRHSAVARRIGAGFLEERPSLQGTYFAYFSGLEDHGLSVYARDRCTIYSWPTNDGATLLGVNWPVDEYAQVRRDPQGHVFKALDQHAPQLLAQLSEGHRESRWIGTASATSFYRQSHGPGWALVGDSGYAIDPGTAQGISDAFRDAEHLAEAILRSVDQQTLDQGLAQYQARRDAETRPMFEFTYQLSALEPPTPEMVAALQALSGDPEKTAQFLGITAGTVSVNDFFSTANLLGSTR